MIPHRSGRGLQIGQVVGIEPQPLFLVEQVGDQALELLASDPYAQSPPYESLVGDLRGACSRRINIQHRLVYRVMEEERIVKVLRVWTHYEQERMPVPTYDQFIEPLLPSRSSQGRILG